MKIHDRRVAKWQEPPTPRLKVAGLNPELQHKVTVYVCRNQAKLKSKLHETEQNKKNKQKAFSVSPTILIEESF